MKLKDSQTYSNLAKAFAGECQAQTRYRFLHYAANQAELTALAKVIKTIITNEFNHARMYYTNLQKADEKTLKNIEIVGGYPFKDKWDMNQNFSFAVENETEEQALYKEFGETANKEGFPDIAKLFTDTAAVEKCHSKMLTQIHQQLVDGTMYKKEKKTKFKCGDCGHEDTLLEAWKICPLCEAKQGAVMLILDSGK